MLARLDQLSVPKEFVDTFRPWNRTLSPLTALPTFHPRLIWDDVLHVNYRGFAPDYLGSCLLDIFGNKLDVALDLARLWRKSRSLKLECDELVLAEGGYATLNCKGHDARILILFMVSCLLLFYNTLNQEKLHLPRLMFYGTSTAPATPRLLKSCD